MTEPANDAPNGYKETELGSLPEEWKVVSLRDIVRLRSEGINPEAAPVMPYVGLEHIDPGDTSLRRHGKASDVKSNKSRFFPDDVLYGKLRPYLDKAVLAGQEGMCSTDILVFEPATNVVPVFLSHLLHTKAFISHAIATTSGVNHPRTSWSSLRRHLVPLPPLPEQQAIAQVLGTVQEAKESTEQVIASARELKRSLMRHLFAYGPVPVEEAEQVPLKETEVGPVPEHWEVVRLGEAVIKTKQINPAKTPDRPFHYVDVSGVSRESLSIQNYAEYAGKEAPSRARKLIELGDTIFATVRPYLKRVSMVPPELDGHVCSTAFCVIRADPDLADPCYLFFAASADDFVERVSEHQRGSSYPAVTDKDVLNEPILLPPLPEQREVARVLSAVDAKIAAEENRRRSLEILFKTLLHDLMTGKLRVKDLGEIVHEPG